MLQNYILPGEFLLVGNHSFSKTQNGVRLIKCQTINPRNEGAWKSLSLYESPIASDAKFVPMFAQIVSSKWSFINIKNAFKKKTVSK